MNIRSSSINDKIVAASFHPLSVTPGNKEIVLITIIELAFVFKY